MQEDLLFNLFNKEVFLALFMEEPSLFNIFSGNLEDTFSCNIRALETYVTLLREDDTAVHEVADEPYSASPVLALLDYIFDRLNQAIKDKPAVGNESAPDDYKPLLAKLESYLCTKNNLIFFERSNREASAAITQLIDAVRIAQRWRIRLLYSYCVSARIRGFPRKIKDSLSHHFLWYGYLLEHTKLPPIDTYASVVHDTLTIVVVALLTATDRQDKTLFQWLVPAFVLQQYYYFCRYVPAPRKLFLSGALTLLTATAAWRDRTFFHWLVPALVLQQYGYFHWYVSASRELFLKRGISSYRRLVGVRDDLFDQHKMQRAAYNLSALDAEQRHINARVELARREAEQEVNLEDNYSKFMAHPDVKAVDRKIIQPNETALKGLTVKDRIILITRYALLGHEMNTMWAAILTVETLAAGKSLRRKDPESSQPPYSIQKSPWSQPVIIFFTIAPIALVYLLSVRRLNLKIFTYLRDMGQEIQRYFILSLLSLAGKVDAAVSLLPAERVNNMLGIRQVPRLSPLHSETEQRLRIDGITAVERSTRFLNAPARHSSEELHLSDFQTGQRASGISDTDGERLAHSFTLLQERGERDANLDLAERFLEYRRS